MIRHSFRLPRLWATACQSFPEWRESFDESYQSASWSQSPSATSLACFPTL